MAGAVTHPAARGRGLARAVCGFVVDALVHRHGRAALIVHDDNPSAIAAYERLGMTKRPFRSAHILAQRGRGSAAAS
ncbi:GNAT family N-acetyltransferase [Kitasatospora sp. GP82]|uniref:GNAT family N-acetyltransferase n=1 Tax=Kitasatospora sp. GP82 TaxID=3035089 RepID=UPI002476B7E3|nr:GNAT family N-acetyltransferase [Kitasatospora sp. GP82]